MRNTNYKRNMKKILLSLTCIAISFSYAWAQQKISGKVLDAKTSDPLIGASVAVIDTATNTVATGGVVDEDGNFTVEAPNPDGSIIRVSYVGYKELKLPIRGTSDFTFEMVESSYDLEEVLVVGYGRELRRDLTGSVARITGETLRLSPVVTLDQAMQGRAAGVQVFQNSGTPGGSIQVRVRGSSSLSASNQPLYVIDGVPTQQGDFSQFDYSGQGTDVLADIDPNSIESIEVLKDASAAAIYGSRAANGVVLITTKRGAAQPTRFHFNAYYGVQEVWKKKKYLNTKQYMDLMNDMYNADSAFWRENYELQDGYDLLSLITPIQVPHRDSLADTDWLDQVLRVAPIQNYEFSAVGGDIKTRFAVSTSYMKQDGIVKGSDYSRLAGRLNLDHNISTKLSIGTSLQVSRSVNNRIVSDNTVFGPFANGIANAPIFPVFNPDGTYAPANYPNALALAELVTGTQTNFRTFGNAFVNYEAVKGLNFKLRGGFDVLNLSERRHIPGFDVLPQSESPAGSGVQAGAEARKWLIEATADYNKTFADKHRITALLGTSWEKNSNERISVSGNGFPSNKFQYLASASQITSGSGILTAWSLQSIFARLSYAYKDKYLFGFNFRTDGSSRFGKDNRYGYFPSVSAGWRINEESFLKPVKWINDLKLRANFGITGNQEIGNFNSLGLMGSGANYAGSPGTQPIQLPNPQLTWETTYQFDAGLDIALFDSRVALILDYYIKNTKDLLFARPIPSTSGYGAYFSNIGSIQNRGVEITLNTENIVPKKNGFGWRTNFNISFNRNEVTELYNNEPFPIGFVSWVQVGQPLGTFYGYFADGVYSRQSDVPEAQAAEGVQAGDIRFRDLDGDGVITAKDQTIIGNGQPDFTGGLTNVLTFKGFELNFFLQFMVGNDVWQGTNNFAESMTGTDNSTDRVLDRWRKEGDVTDMPRATLLDPNNNSRRNSTRYIEDGSFLRLKTLTFAYTFPTALVKKARLQSLRLYFQGGNLLTFTKYSGFDPEVNSTSGTGNSNTSNTNSNAVLGEDFYTYPQARTYTFGINIGF